MTTAYEHKTELVGDDYTGLPMRPRPYRRKPRPTGLDWAALTANHVARGGQVDASVWPEHKGKVVAIGDHSSSRKAFHTWEEATGDGYEETASPASMRVTRPRTKTVKPRARKTATASTPRKVVLPVEKRAEVARRYRDGETIPDLVKAYGVGSSSIQHALRVSGVRIRSRAEAGRLRRERNAS